MTNQTTLPKTYYHVTTKENWLKIKHEGLIPKIGTLSDLCNETEEKIYLFCSIEDMETALSSWLGVAYEDNFDEDTEFVSIKITVPDNFPIEPSGIYECYSYRPIPPQFLSFFRDE